MSLIVNIDTTSTVLYRTDCFKTYSLTDYHIRDNSVYSGWNLGYQKAIDVDPPSPDDIAEIGYCATITAGYYDSIRTQNPIVCDNLLFGGQFSSSGDCDVVYSAPAFSTPAVWFDGEIRGDHILICSGNFYTVDTMRISPTYYTNNPGLVVAGKRYYNGAYTTINNAISRCPVDAARYDDFNIYLGSYNLWAHSTIASFLADNPTYANTEIANVCNAMQYGALLTYPNATDPASTDSGIIVSGHNTISDLWLPIGNMNKGDYPNDFVNTESINGLGMMLIPFASQDEYDAAYAANYKWDSNTIPEVNRYVN